MLDQSRYFAKEKVWLTWIRNIVIKNLAGLIHTFGCGILLTLDLLGELVLIAGLRRSMSSAISCCWIGSAKDTRLDCKVKKEKIVTFTHITNKYKLRFLW